MEGAHPHTFLKAKAQVNTVALMFTVFHDYPILTWLWIIAEENLMHLQTTG